MNQYILINHIKVQNANAIAGFTWGFPAITHFLGFTHNLTRKLAESDQFKDIDLNGCAVIAHQHHVHTYRPSYDFEFTQSKNPAYLKSDVTKVKKGGAPSIIEEGKMNMTVSLLIGYRGNIGNRDESFKKWLENSCYLQRLAGGSILDIGTVDFYSLSEDREVRAITRKLLPGFALMDRSTYLESHYQSLQNSNSNIELLDAWLDFSALKQQARPQSDKISRLLNKLVDNNREDELYSQLLDIWEKHLTTPYQQNSIPDELQTELPKLLDSAQLQQWQAYCNPTDKTEADWEYISKPEKGYLVPIMTGYKAISELYENSKVANTRDSETDVCFMESVHSVGEWLSVHRLKTIEGLNSALWHYHYVKNWYLCKQSTESGVDEINHSDNNEIITENPEDDLS